MSLGLDLSRSTSFEHADLACRAGGLDKVVLAGADGETELIDQDGHFTHRRGTTIDDVAVGERVYTLADGTLAAFGTTGSRLWSDDSYDDAAGLTADPVGSSLVVRTDDGELLWLDGDSGSEVDRRSVPNPEAPGEATVVAYDGVVAAAKYSRLKVFDDGEWAERLDGRADTVGILGDAVVVSLLDGTVRCYRDGSDEWTLDHEVQWLSGAGVDRLFGRDADGLIAIDGDGSVSRPGAVSPDGRYVASTDGSVVCRVADGTATVYRSTEDPATALELSVAESPVTPTAETITLAVHNAGETLVDTTVTVSGEGLTVGTDRATLKIEPGATHQLRVAVRSLEIGEGTISLLTDESVLGSATVEVAEPERTVTTDTELLGVEEGTATVRVTVTNEGTDRIGGGRVGDRDLRPIQPGESAVVETTLATPVESVTVELADVENRTLPLSIPTTALSISLDESDRGYTDVSVENAVSATVRDRLTVTGLPTPDETVSRAVSVPPDGALIWTLPSVVAGERRIEARSTGDGDVTTHDPGVIDGVSTRSRADRRQSQRADSPRRSADDRAVRSETEQSSGDSQSEQQSAGRQDEPQSGARRETQAASVDDTASHAASESKRPESDESITVVESESADTDGSERPKSVGSGAGDSSVSEVAESGVPISVERQVETNTPAAGTAFGERLEVRNEGRSPQEVSVEGGFGDTATTVTVADDTTQTLSRRVVAFESGELPPVRATTDDGAVTTDETELSVETGYLTPYVWLTVGPDGEPVLGVAVTVEGDHECRVEDVTVDGRSLDVTVDLVPGETVREVVTLDTPPSEATVSEATVTVTNGEDSLSLDTLCRRLDPEQVTDPKSSLVGEVFGGGVEDGDGTIYLKLRNEGVASVEDIRLDAVGDTRSIRRGEIERLDPGEEAECVVRLRPDEPLESVELSVSIRQTDTGDEVGTLRASGPGTAETPDETWTVGWEDDSTELPLPSIVVTGFDGD